MARRKKKNTHAAESAKSFFRYLSSTRNDTSGAYTRDGYAWREYIRGACLLGRPPEDMLYDPDKRVFEEGAETGDAEKRKKKLAPPLRIGNVLLRTESLSSGTCFTGRYAEKEASRLARRIAASGGRVVFFSEGTDVSWNSARETQDPSSLKPGKIVFSEFFKDTRGIRGTRFLEEILALETARRSSVFVFFSFGERESAEDGSHIANDIATLAAFGNVFSFVVFEEFTEAAEKVFSVCGNRVVFGGASRKSSEAVSLEIGDVESGKLLVGGHAFESLRDVRSRWRAVLPEEIREMPPEKFLLRTSGGEWDGAWISGLVPASDTENIVRGASSRNAPQPEHEPEEGPDTPETGRET